MTGTTWPRLALALIGLMAGVLLAACSSGNGEATVLQVVPAFAGQGGRDTTIDMVDIGVPQTPNLTSHSVRWERVSLVSVPAAVHLDSVFAYPPGRGIGLVSGNLIKGCPHDKAYPLNAAVVPPHAEMRWNVVIAVTFAKPGRYHLRRIKIVYVTDGHRGWQYQRINTTMVISPARKDGKPRFSGCF